MLSKVTSATIKGTCGHKVLVETDISNGMPGLTVVGLADVMVKEAKERIRAAFENTGIGYPFKRITINMAPADIRKKGTHFDLPMAIGILVSSGLISMEAVKEYGIIGELSLDGSINSSRGILSMVMALKEEHIKNVIVPFENGKEAALIKDIKVYPAGNLLEVINHLIGLEEIPQLVLNLEELEKSKIEKNESRILDFSDVKGQEMAKRAITVAVAGGHGLLMTGSPAAGKTMLAERIPGIMPEMEYEEILESTQIYSVSGLLTENLSIINERPFRQPHHRISAAGLIGGGNGPSPGEISLAHKGVLFLDEVGEFDRDVLDMLRIPLEKKEISMIRRGERYVFPADFLLIAATNPCKCGFYGDGTNRCKCTEMEIRSYRSKLSGPVKDRIDMFIHLQPVEYNVIVDEHNSGSSETMRENINKARKIQKERFKGKGIWLNSQMTDKQIEKYCHLSKEEKDFLEIAYGKFNLNPRTLGKIKKIGRTIADIEGKEKITVAHLTEALQYREVE